MRFVELHLKAYGPFAEQKIDLSGGAFGLHLVYGPNEAGKSSSLRAIHDFLYGIPARTPDNFRFTYPQLRIGAVLQSANGRRLAAMRRKTNSKSLRADDDQATLEEADLTALLNGVDADLFRTMFGIDHQRLREGGDQIVRGKGQLGEMLFAAGAGLVGLRRSRQQLQGELESLLSSAGRKGLILDQLKEYRTLEQQVTAAQVKVSDWLQVTDGLRQANADLNRLKTNHQEILANRGRLERIQNALPIYSSWKQQTERIKTLADVPYLPSNFSSQAQQELSILDQFETEAKILQQRIEANQRQRQNLNPNRELLSMADSIETLRERLIGYEQAIIENPILAKDLQQAEKILADRLRELDCHTDLFALDDLHVAPDRAARIDELGRRHETLRDHLKRLVDEFDNRQKQRQLLQVRSDSLVSTQYLTQLKDMRQVIRDEGNLETSWQEVSRELAKIQNQIELAVRRLPYWQGTWEKLESLALPSLKQIEQLQQQINQIDRQREKTDAAIQQTIDDQADRKIELENLELTGEIPSTDQLRSVRQQRDAAWELIRQQWNEYRSGKFNQQSELAQQVFLKQIKSDETLGQAGKSLSNQADAIADQLYQEADRVARKAKLNLELQRGQERLQQQLDRRDTLNQKQAEWQQQWWELWKSADVSAQAPTEMLAWLNQLDKIQEQICLMREKESQLQQIADRMHRQCRLIQTELQAASLSLADTNQADPHRLELDFQHLPWWRARLEHGCEQLHDTAVEQKQLEKSLQQIDQELDANKVQQETAKTEFVQTGLAWAEEMEGLKLDANALPKQALARVDMIRDTMAQQKETKRIARQVNDSKALVTQFESEASALIQRYLADAKNVQQRGIGVAYRLLCSELGQHQTADRDLRRLDKEHADLLQQQQNLSGDIQRHQKMIANLMQQASIEDRKDLIEIGNRSRQKEEVQERIEEIESQMLGLAGGQSFELFIQELEKEQPNSDTLAHRCEQSAQKMLDITQQIEQAVGQIKELELEQQRFSQVTGAVGLNADRAAIAAEMEHSVQRYLVLKVAAAVLSQGIERYRQKNQLPVLTRASQLFSQMTLGRYLSLKADYDDNGQPQLVALRQKYDGTNGAECEGSGGQSGRTGTGNIEEVGVATMSDGTCDQLYLALRLASLEHWLEQRDEPLPLIVDDILLNFDDDRSRATLKVLAELSRKTQVIFFTHHQRLVELARQTLSPNELFLIDLEIATQ